MITFRKTNLLVFLFLLFFIFACKQEVTEQDVNPNPLVPQPVQEPVEDEAGFITIPIPQNGIHGSGKKGVFVEGRIVKLSPFKASKYEVTYKLWKEVLDWAITHGYVFERLGRKGNRTDIQTSEKEPVTLVSWRDCIVWCNAYTEKFFNSDEQCVYINSERNIIKNAKAFIFEGNTKKYECDDAIFDSSKKGFRLPTEAEWEWSARGGKNEMFAGTNDENSLHLYACFFDNSQARTFEVGKLKHNGYGLYDMSGNVWEWCFDREGNIETGEVLNPIGALSGMPRIARGGSWFNNINYAQITFRQKGAPSYGANHTGFRLFKTL